MGLLLHTLSLAASLAVLAVTYIRAAAADRSHHKTTTNNDKHAYYTPTTTTHRGSSSPPLRKAFLAALPLAAACVLVRCAYRAAAAWGGLGSPIARDLLLWMVAEGALLTEAMVSLAAFHPALCLDDNDDDDRRSREEEDLEVGITKGMGMGGKRYSVAANSSKTLSTVDLSLAGAERGVGVMHQHQQQQREEEDAAAALAHEGSRLMFTSSSSSHVMAPSEAGSSEALGSPRRAAGARGSIGDVLDEAPYYRYEDPFATPPEEEDDLRLDSPYDARYFEDAAADALPSSSRDREQQEQDRFETESFVQPPRKSSKRLSRALLSSSPPSSDAAAKLQHEHGDLTAEAEDSTGHISRSGSFVVSPPRKSSKRQQRPPPARGLSVRSEEDDRLEVGSILLPSRQPSKMSTMRGVEDLDAVSLYSQ